MNPKQFENTAISCNCFPGPYQKQPKLAFINNNKNSAHLTSLWEQKILKKLAKDQRQPQSADNSLLQKTKKKSLKRQTDRSTLQASKKLPEFKTIEIPESLDIDKSSKRLNQIEKNDSDRQQVTYKKISNSLNQNQHLKMNMNHILSISKHQVARKIEIPKYNHTQLVSGHNRMNSMSGNFSNLPSQAANNYNIKIVRASLKQQMQLVDSQITPSINIIPDKKQQGLQIVKKTSFNQQNQWQEGLLSPNSIRRSPRKSHRKQCQKQIKPRTSHTPRQSYRPNEIADINILNNGSVDPKASKKYSLTQSTANKTLMKPRQIESVLDSDSFQQDRFSEVVMDMNRIEDFSQIEKVSTHQALKNFFMKGTMMGTNASESWNLSSKHIQ